MVSFMPQKIHLIEKLGYIKPLEGNIHESGFWDVKHSQAEALIGGDIYFHKRQKEPSFFGGKILGYRVHEEDDDLKGRIIFRFEYSRAHKKVLAGAEGWSYEKKIV
jgi:hypothetical protein